MKKFKKPLLFTLALLPIAAIATWFTALYQFDLYDQTTLELLVAQVGSMEAVILISVAQTVLYVAIAGFFGYILAEKTGLMRPLGFEKKAIFTTLGVSVLCGILFGLDYWTFGAWFPEIQQGTRAGMTAYGWIASVLYSGIIEEILLRLFVMTLAAWLLWKLFFRKQESIPTGVIIAANILAAILFAAGHLPATATAFGTLTPLLLFRCFLLNGGFGILFGWLYRKYGIQYAMVSHATLHIVSKVIWSVFI